MAFIARLSTGGTSSAVPASTVVSINQTFAVGTLAAVTLQAWNGSSGSTTSITDSQSNTWINHVKREDTTVGLVDHWSSLLTTPLASGDTITVTMSGGSAADNDYAVVADFHSGMTNAGAEVTTVANSGVSSTTPSVSLTPTRVGTLYGAVGTFASGTVTEDADSVGGDTWHTLTKLTTTTTGRIAQVSGAYKLTTSAVAQTYNPTLSASQAWNTFAVNYPLALAPTGKVVQLNQAVTRAATW